MTSDDTTVAPMADFEAGTYPVEVIAVWKSDIDGDPMDRWHLVTVLYQDQGGPVEVMPPWTAPVAGTVPEGLDGQWAYCAERVREGRGGNIYSYELEGFEVVTKADIAAVVAARAAHIADHGIFAAAAGTMITDQWDAPGPLIIPFDLLGDDSSNIALVATTMFSLDDFNLRGEERISSTWRNHRHTSQSTEIR